MITVVNNGFLMWRMDVRLLSDVEQKWDSLCYILERNASHVGRPEKRPSRMMTCFSDSAIFDIYPSCYIEFHNCSRLCL
jgi:hypothetical protein